MLIWAGKVATAMPKFMTKSGVFFKFVLTALLLSAFRDGTVAKADTTAVTPSDSSGVGYIDGAVGFSFTPVTNIVVTQIGYRDHGANTPVISFWSDTNYV